MIRFTRMVVIAAILICAIARSSVAENKQYESQRIVEIIAQLRSKASKSSSDYFWQTPFVYIAAISGQLTIPPQRRQYLDLAYIQSVSPEMCRLQPDSLSPLSEMLKSSNSFERETVTELMNFEAEKHHWTFTPEFCNALASQIGRESVTEVQFDLIQLSARCDLTSPSVLKSLCRWVRKNYMRSEFAATAGISSMAIVLASAPLAWTQDTDAALEILSDLSRSKDENIRYRSMYAIQNAFATHPDTRYVPQLMEIVKTGLADSSNQVSPTAVNAVGALGQHSAPYLESTLLPFLDTWSKSRPDLVDRALAVCARIGPPAADSALPRIIHYVQAEAEGTLNQQISAVCIARDAVQSFDARVRPMLPALRKIAQQCSDKAIRILAQKAVEKLEVAEN